MGFKYKQLSMHVREEKLENFDEIAATYMDFVAVSQFVHPQPNHVNQLGQLRSHDFRLLKSADCRTAERLYGVDDNGNLTLLLSKVDSSD